MKKYFVVSLALLLGCSLTACQSKPKDAKQVYDEAQKKTLKMESYTVDLDMTMTMDISMEDMEEENTTFEFSDFVITIIQRVLLKTEKSHYFRC